MIGLPAEAMRNNESTRIVCTTDDLLPEHGHVDLVADRHQGDQTGEIARLDVGREDASDHGHAPGSSPRSEPMAGVAEDALAEGQHLRRHDGEHDGEVVAGAAPAARDGSSPSSTS